MVQYSSSAFTYCPADALSCAQLPNVQWSKQSKEVTKWCRSTGIAAPSDLAAAFSSPAQVREQGVPGLIEVWTWCKHNTVPHESSLWSRPLQVKGKRRRGVAGRPQVAGGPRPNRQPRQARQRQAKSRCKICLLYTSDAADE